MKTAISIPDKVFQKAEKLARRLGQSRSQLYATALKSYIDHQTADDVTQKLNVLYGSTPSKLDPSLQKLQTNSIAKEKW